MPSRRNRAQSGNRRDNKRMRVVACLSFLVLGFAQDRTLNKVNTQAVASFQGTLKSADKKWVILAVENGESLKMFVTGKTRFIRDGKSAKPGDFHDGEQVTADAERDLRLNMLCIKLEYPPVEDKKPTAKP